MGRGAKTGRSHWHHTRTNLLNDIAIRKKMDVTTELSCAYLASGLKTSIVKAVMMKSTTGNTAVTLKPMNSVWNTSGFENSAKDAEGNVIDSSQASHKSKK